MVYILFVRTLHKRVRTLAARFARASPSLIQLPILFCYLDTAPFRLKCLLIYIVHIIILRWEVWSPCHPPPFPSGGGGLRSDHYTPCCTRLSEFLAEAVYYPSLKRSLTLLENDTKPDEVIVNIMRLLLLISVIAPVVELNSIGMLHFLKSANDLKSSP